MHFGIIVAPVKYPIREEINQERLSLDTKQEFKTLIMRIMMVAMAMLYISCSKAPVKIQPRLVLHNGEIIQLSDGRHTVIADDDASTYVIPTAIEYYGYEALF